MLKVYNWLNCIQDILFPPTCILCGNPGFGSLDLCEICYRHLPRNINHCICCAEVFEPAVTDALLCGRCISKTPAFDQVYAPFIHQEEIRYLIAGLKFGQQLKNARLLGSLLAETLQFTPDKPDCIIPVPLHPSRYQKRGFNQALEIAHTVSAKLQVPIDAACCQRQKDTPHQTGLTAKKRQENLRRAFSVVKPIKHRHVAILDDVMTTGSTANALAGELKRAGIERVEVWVCGRA